MKKLLPGRPVGALSSCRVVSARIPVQSPFDQQPLRGTANGANALRDFGSRKSCVQYLVYLGYLDGGAAGRLTDSWPAASSEGPAAADDSRLDRLTAGAPAKLD
jgi:hypothetical protein